MGLAHVACVAKMNTHTAQGLGHHAGWYACPTCGQNYTGAMRLALARAPAHQVRGRRRDDDHRLCAEGNLGTALQEVGEHAEAEKVQKRVLAARTRVSDKNHPATLTAANDLANTHGDQGKLTEAAELQVWVLAASERVQGKDHQATFGAAHNLADTCHNQGRLAEAAEQQVRVLAASERVRGKDHPNTLDATGNLATGTGQEPQHDARAPAARRQRQPAARVSVTGARGVAASVPVCAADTETGHLGQRNHRVWRGLEKREARREGGGLALST